MTDSNQLMFTASEEIPKGSVCVFDHENGTISLYRVAKLSVPQCEACGAFYEHKKGFHCQVGNEYKNVCIVCFHIHSPLEKILPECDDPDCVYCAQALRGEEIK